MYEQYFGFRELPFQLTPDPDFFFDSRAHRKAAAYLKYGIAKGEGFVLITGEVGTGKTTLVDYLCKSLHGNRIIAAHVVTSRVASTGILRMVAASLDLPFRGKDKATLLIDLQSFFRQAYENKARILLFIDEVQNVPFGALEELRMLSNFKVDQRPLLQVFLVGQPQFRKKLAHKDFEQLRQRMIASYHLESLNSEETERYIVHRLKHVGWRNNPTFAPDSFGVIFEATDGVPRKINILCDRLLLHCYLEQLRHIDTGTVKAVVADMEGEWNFAAHSGGPQNRGGISKSGQDEAVPSEERDDGSNVTPLREAANEKPDLG